MRRGLLFVLLILPACGVLQDLGLRDGSGVATVPATAGTRPVEDWRDARRQAALTALDELGDLTDPTARRVALARIHTIGRDVLFELPTDALAGLAPQVLRVYHLDEALRAGPDTTVVSTSNDSPGIEPDGDELRVERIASLVRASLPADAWPRDGAFLDRTETALVVLQTPERFALIETALDRFASIRTGSILLHVDLLSDGEDLARGLGVDVSGERGFTWIPRAPAAAIVAKRGRHLAAVQMRVPWGRRAGTWAAPGRAGRSDGDAGKTDRPSGMRPGLSVAAVLMPPGPEHPEFERLQVEIVWTRPESELEGSTSVRIFRRRLELPARSGIPALTAWKDGPAAVLQLSPPTVPLSAPRRGWRREEPPPATHAP
jgi:hypothetical protein